MAQIIGHTRVGLKFLKRQPDSCADPCEPVTAILSDLDHIDNMQLCTTTVFDHIQSCINCHAVSGTIPASDIISIKKAVDELATHCATLGRPVPTVTQPLFRTPPTSTQSPSHTAPIVGSPPDTHLGVLVGGAVGGAAILLLVALFVFYLVRGSRPTSPTSRTEISNGPSSPNHSQIPLRPHGIIQGQPIDPSSASSLQNPSTLHPVQTTLTTYPPTTQMVRPRTSSQPNPLRPQRRQTTNFPRANQNFVTDDRHPQPFPTRYHLPTANRTTSTFSLPADLEHLRRLNRSSPQVGVSPYPGYPRPELPPYTPPVNVMGGPTAPGSTRHIASISMPSLLDQDIQDITRRVTTIMRTDRGPLQRTN